MRIGVPKETVAGERRVAIVPETIGRLPGFEVTVERGAGLAAGYTDEAYTAAGATMADDAYGGVEAVAKVQKPNADELERLVRGQVLIAFLAPLSDREGSGARAASGR